MRYKHIKTPFGTLKAGASDAGLHMLRFDSDSSDYRLPKHLNVDELVVTDKTNEILESAANQLRLWANDASVEFDVPIHLSGTSFQREVWQELCNITSGSVISYQELAKRVGRTRDSSRAVASANRANPIVIIVPCHRVIGANGDLQGYSGRPEIKRRLLQHEGMNI